MSLVQGRREIDWNLSPGLVFFDIFRKGDDPSLDCPVGIDLHKGVFNGTALSHPASYVEDYPGMVVRGKGKPLKSNSFRGGQFRFDPIIFQQD